MNTNTGVRRKFSRGPKFYHNCVTSQINLGSAEGTTTRVVRGHAQKKIFPKLHLKIRIFVPVKSEASRKQKSVCIVVDIQNSGAEARISKN